MLQNYVAGFVPPPHQVNEAVYEDIVTANYERKVNCFQKYTCAPSRFNGEYYI
jgi:hypothetical protein